MPIGWINDGGSATGGPRPSLATNPGWIGQNDPSAIGQEMEVELPPMVREVIAITWMRWETLGDDRVCPVCAGLNGRVWQTGTGLFPPLHDNCRCRRALAWVEYIAVDRWR